MSGDTPTDLGLTNDEVIARYLRVIADGPKCVAHLRGLGFETWRDRWWGKHGDDAQRPMRIAGHVIPVEQEWDSRNYDNSAMREIYDGIIAHASRTVQS